MTSWPDHSALLDEAYGAGVVQALIGRAHWRSAKSVEHVPGGAHQYVVLGQAGLTDHEFWNIAHLIKAHGRDEWWQSPPGFYSSGKRPTFRGQYLYPGDGHAYWFTHPKDRSPMLNREHLSVQEQTPTRRAVEPDSPAQTQLDL